MGIVLERVVQAEGLVEGKRPELGVCFGCVRNSKEANMPREIKERGREG